MFEIRLAADRDELEALYRFRYQIYIEEMNRVQHDADHDRKRITDSLDEHGHNLLAFKADKLVGTVRLNFTCHGPIPYYSDFYRINEQPGVARDNTCIVTRLMISQEMRRSTLALRLCVAVYEFCLERGIRYSFMDCNDHLVAFFKSFGWHHYMGTALHKEYGEVHPLKFDLHDERLFQNLNSPILETFLAWKNREQSYIDNADGEQAGLMPEMP